MAAVVVATAVPTVLTEPTIPLCTSAAQTSCATALNTPPGGPTQLEPYTLPCTSGPPTNCTTSYNFGQPVSNPAGYLVVGGAATAASGHGGLTARSTNGFTTIR